MSELAMTWVPAIGRALLHFVWQGAAIGLLAAATLQLLRDARPQLRYAVACVALLACALAPVLDVLAGLGSEPGSAVVAAGGTLTSGGSGSVLLPLGAPGATRGTGLWLAARPDLDVWLPAIVAAWAAGAALLSLRMAFGVAWVRRIARAPQSPAHAAWQERLDRLAATLAPARTIALRLVDGLGSPCTAGWWHPVVLLPTAVAMRLPVELVEALLAHELAHVRRHDYLVNLLQTLVEALLFYHPVTWWLSRRIRAERELIADQLAARVVEPRRLAQALAALADMPRDTAFPALAPAAHGGPLMSRIEQLVRPGRRHGGTRTAFPLMVLAAACITVFAQAQAGSKPAVPVAQSAPAAAPVTAARQIRGVAAPAAVPTQAATATAKPVAAASAPERERRISQHGDHGPTFAIVQKSRTGITMSGDVDEVGAIERARDRLGQDFVWFRRDGKAYVVTDAETVRRAADAWRAAEANGHEMEKLGAQMEVHGRKMEAIGAQMQAVSARKATKTPEIEAASKRIDQLSREMAKIGAAMATAKDAAEQERLERDMDVLDRRQDALSERMEAESNTIDAVSERMNIDMKPMDDLGRQMDEAGKPMEALGRQMDVLGKEQDRLSAQAERETRALIDTAVSRGLASPAP